MEKKRGDTDTWHTRAHAHTARATDFLLNDSPLSLRFFCASKDAPRGERFVSFKVMQSGFRWPPLIGTAYLRRWFREFRGANRATNVFLPFVRKEGKAERRILKGRNFILHLAYFNGFYMYDNSSQMYYILCNETRWINSYYDNVFKTIVITKVRFIKF